MICQKTENTSKPTEDRKDNNWPRNWMWAPLFFSLHVRYPNASRPWDLHLNRAHRTRLHIQCKQSSAASSWGVDEILRSLCLYFHKRKICETAVIKSSLQCLSLLHWIVVTRKAKVFRTRDRKMINIYFYRKIFEKKIHKTIDYCWLSFYLFNYFFLQTSIWMYFKF